MRSGAAGLGALALLCTSAFAFADEAPGADKAKPAEHPMLDAGPHWFDGLADKKFVAVDGSSIELTEDEQGLSVAVTAADGTGNTRNFDFLSPALGSIYDDKNADKAIGVFRQSDTSLEAEYADGHTETMTANAGGGITISARDGSASLTCLAWYPQGHVFSEGERKMALDAYAAKLGIAPAAKKKPAPARTSCVDAPTTVAQAARPSRIVLHAPKTMTAMGPIVVRDSTVHAIDPDAPAFGSAPAGGSLSLAAHAPIAPAMAVQTQAQAIPASAQAIPASNQEVAHSMGASSCLDIDTDGANWGFRNSCDYSVQFAYCLQNGTDKNTACGSGNAEGAVGARSFYALLAATAVIDDDHQFRWVACSGAPGEVAAKLDRTDPPAGRCVRSTNS